MVDSRIAWTRARFSLNGAGRNFSGFHDGQKWNGFACPVFPHDEASAIVASVVASGESYEGHCFNKRADQFTLTPHGGQNSEFTKGQVIVLSGAPVQTAHVYRIGEGWCWNIVGPDVCEACDVKLTEDFQCPKCGVSHTAAPCATCGRFGLHKDDCTEPPGHDTEGGPAYVRPEDRVSEEKAAAIRERALVKIFQTAYQYYNGWGFDYMHPGFFSFYQLGGDLRVFFTPDFNEQDVVDVQVHDASGEAFDNIGESHPFKGEERTAPALFRIVKPYLDRLEGKSAAELKKAN